MATTTTPNLGLTLAVPGSNEPFSTSVVNANFTAIDTAVGTATTKNAAQDTRLDTIERQTLPATPTGFAGPGVIPAGTSAQRDAYWGVPATAADRVALAGKRARWDNSDPTKGYVERYYSATADASAVATQSATTAGWYPDSTASSMPFMRLLFPSTVKTWAELTLGDAAGTALYTESSDLWGWRSPTVTPHLMIPTIPGRYKLEFAAFLPFAANTAFIRAFKNGVGMTGGSAGTIALGGGPVSGFTMVDMNGTTDSLYINVYGGNISGAVTADITLTYLGPTR